MTVHFKQVTIVGVGLIGGSMGMILKREGLADRVVGVGRTLANLELAVQVGAIDAYERDPKAAIPGTELVILATHVESYAGHLKEWGHLLDPGTIVSDVGSVKGPLVEQVEALVPAGVYFVGAHPIAGKESSGVGEGSVDLFVNALCLVTPTANTDPQALRMVQHVWETMGSIVRSIDPFVHDWILGAVSHLPHVAAFALMNALTDLQERDEADLPDYAGGGLRDTTRIAAASPEMWRDIFLWNADNLLTMIEAMEKHLQRFKALIQAKDGPGLEREIAKAREARQRLK
ncbi:MAG: prephenate dehydrogenase/arogenate dehydrogenase family protein [Nitrospira sp.]|nr:prephenate dehydrogenase/arogenate dehydrogenase family protein [Nitrospira sp.]